MTESKGLAIVTGGSRGIGRANVESLAADGFHVLFTYVSKPEKAEEVIASVEETGGQATSIACDIHSRDDLERLFKQADTLAIPLRVVVSNAAIFEVEPFEAISETSFARMVNANMRAPLMLAQLARPRFGVGARMIFISSVSARDASPGYISYAMTKGALGSLARALAVEWGTAGITVNVVRPGLTDTDMASALADYLPEAVIQGAIEATALKRIGQPSDIAGFVSLLAGPDSLWITGQEIDCNGGYRLDASRNCWILVW